MLSIGLLCYLCFLLFISSVTLICSILVAARGRAGIIVSRQQNRLSTIGWADADGFFGRECSVENLFRGMPLRGRSSFAVPGEPPSALSGRFSPEGTTKHPARHVPQPKLLIEENSFLPQSTPRTQRGSSDKTKGWERSIGYCEIHPVNLVVRLNLNTFSVYSVVVNPRYLHFLLQQIFVRCANLNR